MIKNKRLTFLSIFLITALVLSGLSTTLVQAQEPDDEKVMELTGTIIGIDENAGTFELEVEVDEETTEVFIIQVGDDFDFTAIEVGMIVEMEGTLLEDGDNTVVLSDYSIEEEDDEEDDDDGEDGEGYFCEAETEDRHPVALAIAETYETDYETVIDMFCGKNTEGEGEEDHNRNGFGNIMLAYHTAEISGSSVEDVMSLREEGQGWGQIWQELVDDFGKPDHAGPPEDKGKPDDVGGGKPEDTGKPEDAGPPDHAGKPDHAGPRK